MSVLQEAALTCGAVLVLLVQALELPEADPGRGVVRKMYVYVCSWLVVLTSAGGSETVSLLTCWGTKYLNEHVLIFLYPSFPLVFYGISPTATARRGGVRAGDHAARRGRVGLHAVRTPVGGGGGQRFSATSIRGVVLAAVDALYTRVCLRASIRFGRVLTCLCPRPRCRVGLRMGAKAPGFPTGVLGASF